MTFTTKVTSIQHSYGKAPANMDIYKKQAQQLKETRKREAEAAMEAAARNEKISRFAASEMSANKIMLEGLKNRVRDEITRYVPILVLNEFFSRVMINALPHDKEYIDACTESIVVVNKVFLHHLGGMKYLKEQSEKIGTPLLKKLYKMVKENSDEIVKDKLEELKNASSEDEVNSIMDTGIKDEQIEKIDRDIEDLGPDEISELVQNKVLTVVKDESKRQSEDAEFRAELSRRAEEYENQNNEKLNDSISSSSGINDDGEVADNEERVNDNGSSVEGEDREQSTGEEEPQSESGKLVKYLTDPTIVHEHTLFYSMLNNIYYEKIKAASVKEGAEEVNTSTRPAKKDEVLTSPLNFNMFDVYLNDYQDDLKHVDHLRIANKTPIAGEEIHLDTSDVLAEALMQYTLLETAMTINLITPTPTEVRKVSQYYMRARK